MTADVDLLQGSREVWRRDNDDKFSLGFDITDSGELGLEEALHLPLGIPRRLDSDGVV